MALMDSSSNSSLTDTSWFSSSHPCIRASYQPRLFSTYHLKLQEMSDPVAELLGSRAAMKRVLMCLSHLFPHHDSRGQREPPWIERESPSM